jgi:7,8-dihydropterin-6-yl-methyl-4-(beta-D-ribofuranosyl)aminobenzene 5'-phosphate synthase
LEDVSKKELSEIDICDLYITPAIKAAGWDQYTQIRREVTLTSGPVVVRGELSARNKKKKKFADYVLHKEPGIPIAVVEAKDNTKTISHGLQQAIGYAAILEVPSAFSSNGDGFGSHNTVPENGEDIETEFPMSQFPSPDVLWKRYKKKHGIVEEELLRYMAYSCNIILRLSSLPMNSRVYALLLVLLVVGFTLAAQSLNRITIISDAFGSKPGLEQDWGYAALVEYNGRTILFDSGNDSAKFAKNVDALGIDLRELDAVVISHRHGDHTDGLHHLRSVNPDVPVFAPSDEHFGGLTPPAFFKRPEPSLPSEQRYFSGVVPEVVPHGTAWRGLNIIRGAGGREIFPGIHLVENLAPGKEFGETPELTLVVATPAGQVVLVGCSHPGISQILTSIEADTKPVALLAGGLHLITDSDKDVERVALELRERWGIRRIAPGHCSGEYAFAVLLRLFGSRFIHAGVGEVIAFQ